MFMGTIVRAIPLLCAILWVGVFFVTQANALDASNRFVRHTQIDPVFAWPAVDLDDMKKVISVLEQSRSEIASLVKKQYGPAQQKRVDAVLYPTEFFSQMILLEKLRRGLTSTSSMKALRSYQSQLEQTIITYQNYLDQLLPALEQTIREQDYKGLQYHFGNSSFKHFLGGINSYRKQSAEIMEEAKIRWKCLENDHVNCAGSIWEIFPKISPAEVDDTVLSGAAATIVTNLHTNSQVGGKPIQPAWAVMSSHQCSVYQPQMYFSLWEFDVGTGVPVWRAEVVNDVLVHDHRLSKENVNNYERLLHTLGAEGFLHQSATNHYACPDIGSDTGLIRAMVYIYRTLETMDWDNVQAGSPEDQIALADLESMAKKITKQNYVDEYGIHSFMRDLSILLDKYTYVEAATLWGNQTLATLEEAMLAYKFRTPFLSRDIMNVVYSNTAIGDYTSYAPWDFLEELLFTRNAPELLLGGSNVSVIRENYPQVERHRKGVSPRLRSYNEDLSNLYTVEQFTEILVHGANAEKALGELQKRSYLGGN